MGCGTMCSHGTSDTLVRILGSQGTSGRHCSMSLCTSVGGRQRQCTTPVKGRQADIAASVGGRQIDIAGRQTLERISGR